LINPHTGRKVEHDGQQLRELPISFGRAGYVALYQLAEKGDVHILAIRHQREDDYR
jgi:plasmid stabilization system protein ParE